MERCVEAISGLYQKALAHLRSRVVVNGKLDRGLLAEHQVACHALAFVATESEACRQLLAWSERIGGAYEKQIAAAYIGEVARALSSSVDLGACESVHVRELGLSEADLRQTVLSPEVQAFVAEHAHSDQYLAIARHAHEHGCGALGLEDATLSDIQQEFARFCDQQVIPIAQDVHRRDVLIPIEIIEQLSEMGVFGLTIPETYGGLGLGKVAMCVVTEELSRGYIGVGSLGTRSEIASELIMGGGTEEQKAYWLPKIATGEVLPTAVFTEPNHGSDAASFTTRAVKQGDGSYVVNGAKTWITHASRTDLMTLMARTNPEEPGARGLSMFLVKKQRGLDEPGKEFPDDGLTGTEIKVLGYRGMKEYELSFDGFRVDADALLGGEEGKAFKQLMATFEGARIQTAARAVGVAQAAFNEAMRYAHERIQFGRPLADFGRVGRKLGRMVCRLQAARQLAYFSAREKDGGKRCDLEAGMAKLLATRAAWENADAGVQIHGGNGYAEEYTISRLLVDARVLSIFEGANEIQADVIARRLLGG
ncbi:MAG: acyl-CoA/acyl-ACP dehydrogenase [Myxococcales bacterium]|nr:acyl-CoA/acyl-ACP dehydrogenase [Myxococcales bacterium]MDD9966421.1 acyl-CoA/acyl-ACP dehydrogenase [Myxococcales bacterium]